MKFSRQILIALMSLTIACVAGLCVVIEGRMEREAHREFVARFTTLGNTIAAAAVSAETTIDAFAANALLAIRATEGSAAPLTWDGYQRLAASVGVITLSVYDLQGNYVSWPQQAPPPEMRLFDVCYAYQALGERSATPWTTPFLRSFHDNPAKFAMMPSLDGQRILSVKVQSAEIGRLLQEAVSTDPHIRGMELSTLQGVPLASAYDTTAEALQGADDARFEFIVPSTVKDCCQCVQQGLVTDGADYGYRLKLYVSRSDLLAAVRTGRFELAVLFCAVMAGAALVAVFVARQLSRQLETIDEVAAELVAAHDFAVPAKATEISRLSVALDAFATQLRKQADTEAAAVKSRDLARMAQRVAHDMRSPVSALQLASEQATGLLDEERVLIHAAVDRIRSIANELLKSYAAEIAGDKSPASTGVARVVRGIVAEKKSLYARKSIQWSTRLAPGTDALDITLPPVELGRILSNLIDNAVEASGDTGTVEIHVTRDDRTCTIAVRDTGHGIAAVDIPRVLGGGVSINKKNGNGVGLHSAKDAVEKHGGKLTLTSQVGAGTTIVMQLPLREGAREAA